MRSMNNFFRFAGHWHVLNTDHTFDQKCRCNRDCATNAILSIECCMENEHFTRDMSSEFELCHAKNFKYILFILFLFHLYFSSLMNMSCKISNWIVFLKYLHTTLWAERSFRLTVAGCRKNSSSESGTFTLIALIDLS